MPGREREIIERTGEVPATRASLVADLLRLGVRPGMTLIVHASLSSLGWVVGGAEGALYALEDAVGPAGTLVMPAFSYSIPEPSRWTNPPVPEAWWDTIRKNWPPFDPDVTPTRGVGTIAEVFRRQPGTLRSHHPNQSIAARGPEAYHITCHHHLDFSDGARSPLDRVYDLEGKILLLGVDHSANSSLHLAEFRARWKGRDERVHFDGRMVRNGHVVRVRFEDLDGTSDDFGELGRDFERETGLVTIGKVGQAEARLVDQRTIVDYAFEWLPKHRGELKSGPSREKEELRPRGPTYQMRPPAPLFPDEGSWHQTKRRSMPSRTRR